MGVERLLGGERRSRRRELRVGPQPRCPTDAADVILERTVECGAPMGSLLLANEVSRRCCASSSWRCALIPRRARNMALMPCPVEGSWVEAHGPSRRRARSRCLKPARGTSEPRAVGFLAVIFGDLAFCQEASFRGSSPDVTGRARAEPAYLSLHIDHRSLLRDG
jgi:hypothetical protein